MWVRALVVVAVLVGCGGQIEPPAATTTRATGVAGIDPAKRAAFLAGVVAVKRLGGTDDRIVRAGRETCADLAGGGSRAQVVGRAAQRFSTDSVTVTPGEAEKLVEVTERTLC